MSESNGASFRNLSNEIRVCGLAEAWWNDEIARAVGDADFCLGGTVDDADFGKRSLEGLTRTVLEAGAGLAPGKFIEGGERDAEGLFNGRGLVVLLAAKYNHCTLHVWGRDRALAESVRATILAAIPKAKPISRDDLVPFAFWRSVRDEDVTFHLKNILCPSFAEVATNYTLRIRSKIDDLIKHVKPDDAGKIIVWFGPPGTGKTHAVRALAREWVKRLHATAEVVLDPEAMFGSAARMHSIVLSEGQSEGVVDVLHHRSGFYTEKRSGDESPPLRLIILEDAAELFSSGCRTTQGFARFLNVTDGIVGQGLRCIFLLTANEEVGRVDEALTRPGRCLQALEFEAFGKAEARAWLEARGADPDRAPERATLAELFAIKDSKESLVPVLPSGRVGF